MVATFKPLKGEYMKSFLLNTILASVAFSAPAFAAQDKCEDVTPKYKNRLSASPTSISYERTAEDSINVSFEHFEAPAFVQKNVDTTASVTSIKIGQNFSFDCRSRLIPSVGVSMFKDTNEGLFYADVKDEKGTAVSARIKVTNPYLFHGTLGMNAEYDIMKSITFGLNVHGMMGSVWGSEVRKISEMSWGLNTSVPITFRFGTDAHWDVRMEPFAFLLKDYANYVGGKAALGYRF